MRAASLRRDLLLHSGLSFLRVLILGLLIRVASAEFTPALLGVFLLARRFADTGGNLLQAGTSLTLMRYLPMHSGDVAMQRDHVLVAIVWWSVVTVLVVPLAIVLGEPMAAWMYPTYEASLSLARVTSALTVATILGFLALSILLAHRRMIAANLLAALNGGSVALAYLVVRESPPSPETPLFLQAGATLVVSAFVLRGWLRTLPAFNAKRPRLRRVVGNFVAFGGPRGVAAFLDANLLFVAPFLVREDPETAGVVLVALVVLRILQAAVQPASQLAFIVTAELLGARENEKIGEGVRLLLGAVIYASAFLAAVLVPWGGFLIHIWIGNVVVASRVEGFLWLLWVGLLPFLLFQSLKGLIDARSIRPLNLATLLSATAIHVACFQLIRNFMDALPALKISLMLTLWVVGSMSVFWVREYLPLLSYWGFSQLFNLAGVVFLLNLVLAADPSMLTLFVAALASALVGYCGLSRISSPFIRDLFRNLRAEAR